MGTVLVADAAFPFDYARLPHGVHWLLGYVGQPACTPHIWEQWEIDKAHAAGLGWAPIWTPPQAAFSAQGGRQAGNGMVQALSRLKLPAGLPCFLDIEQNSYAADPAGARAGVAEWQAIMHDNGHPQAWAYLPGYASTQWAADWVGTAPQHFAPGVIGVQYAGNVDNGRYDLSVFSDTVFAPPPPIPGTAAMTLNQADKVWIAEQFGTVQTNVLNFLHGLSDDGWKGHPHPWALTHLADQLAELHTQVAKISPGTTEAAVLANQIAALLGPHLAVEVADLLAHRLAT